jgi:hypothetical protein
MQAVTTIGFDIAKSVFQVHGVDATRWGAGDTALYRKYAAEFVASTPDVVLATANSIVAIYSK